MLAPEPEVLLCRQAFADAQAAMIGNCQLVGFFTVGWYGTSLSDERGSFGVVNTTGPLLGYIGDFLQVTYRSRSVRVYIIGSDSTLTADVALTRRAYMGVSLLADEPTLMEVCQLL